MAHMPATTREGEFIVIRERGSGAALGKVPLQETKKRTYRAVIRALTNGGDDIIGALVSIMRGEVVTPKYEKEGTVFECEPLVPTISDQRQAATELMHMLYGKPVAQTEVAAAEETAQEIARVQEMSDEQLMSLVRVKPEPALPAGGDDE